MSLIGHLIADPVPIPEIVIRSRPVIVLRITRGQRTEGTGEVGGTTVVQFEDARVLPREGVLVPLRGGDPVPPQEGDPALPQGGDLVLPQGRDPVPPQGGDPVLQRDDPVPRESDLDPLCVRDLGALYGVGHVVLVIDRWIGLPLDRSLRLPRGTGRGSVLHLEPPIPPVQLGGT